MDGRMDGHPVRRRKTKCAYWVDKWMDKISLKTDAIPPPNVRKTGKMMGKTQEKTPLFPGCMGSNGLDIGNIEEVDGPKKVGKPRNVVIFAKKLCYESP